jgi:hypothetical protein
MPSRRGGRPGGALPRASALPAPKAVRTPRPCYRPVRGAGSLEGVERILIDGRNVQRTLERSSTSASLPTAALVGRLRAALPTSIEVELILDGHPDGGPMGRLSKGFTVAFSRGRTADELIADRVFDTFRSVGAVGAWSVLVISDDREVRDQARRHGVRVEGTVWLAKRLAMPVGGGAGPIAGGGTGARPGTSLGHGRAPRQPRAERNPAERDLG